MHSNGLLIVFFPEANLLHFFMLNKKARQNCVLYLFILATWPKAIVSSQLIILILSAAGAVSISTAKDEAGKPQIKSVDNYTKEMFLPFRCFCSRKDVCFSFLLFCDFM